MGVRAGAAVAAGALHQDKHEGMVEPEGDGAWSDAERVDDPCRHIKQSASSDSESGILRLRVGP